MFDAVVTFVTNDGDDNFIGTKVYRLEFESEEAFVGWLRQGSSIATNTEQLRGVRGQ